MESRIYLICVAVLMLVASASAAPDLEVSDIYPNYVFTDLTNVLSVNVTNAGDATAGSCDVNLTIGQTVLTGQVPELGAGNSTVVEIGNWKPTVLENISMTAFVDCNGGVDEGTNESNNELTVSRNTTGDCIVDDMLPDTCFGYRGQNPMTAVYSGTGKVIYSVGDSVRATHIANFTIGDAGDKNQVDGLTADVPDGATITNAMLYVYYGWRKAETSPNPGLDPTLDFEMSINGGSTLNAEGYYIDSKGFATYATYQYGTIVYNVIANVTGNGDYQAVRSNYAYGKGQDYAMALVITYYDGSDDTYEIAHGYDRLVAYYASDSTDFNVLLEDATTTATFTDIDPDTISKATLFTVAIDTGGGGGGDESQKINDCPWDVGAWSSDNGSYMSFNRGEVTSCITPSGTEEVVQFQERNGNGFAPVFACLQEGAGDSLADSDSDGVPDCWDDEPDTPSGYLTDSDGRGYHIGDVNRDGKLTSVDAMMILQAIVGNIEL